MAPYDSAQVVDTPDFIEVPDVDQNLDPKPENVDNGVTTATASYFIFLGSILCLWLIVFLVVKLLGQKSRDPQQRPRMYVSSARNRSSSLSAQAPSIYITPANMPPPKYEAMAPPSYEEVVGIHYPQYASTAGQPAPAQTAAQPPPPAPPGYDTASTASAAPPAVRTVVPAETTISISS